MSDAAIRLAFFLTILTTMGIWESLAPHRQPVLARGMHWLGNLSLLALNVILLRLLFPAGAVAAAAYSAQWQTGLLHWLSIPPLPAILLSVLLLDLLIYAQHVLFHHVPWLWCLHMVHHSDRDLDVTSGLRFHPLEIMLSMLIKYAAILLLGAPLAAVIIFEVLLNGMAMFNHANIRLPRPLESWLRVLIVTPDMHRIHHSVIRRETNSNFGFNLSVWDRLFGTYTAQPQAGHQAMIIGLSQYQQHPTHYLPWMLRLPFTGDMGQYPGLQTQQGEHHER